MTYTRNIHALFHGHTVSTETRQLPDNMKPTRSCINNAVMSGGSRGVSHSGTQCFKRLWRIIIIIVIIKAKKNSGKQPASFEDVVR
jgi:hypothetical protein